MTSEFDSLAHSYNSFRPNYPQPLMDTVIAFALEGRNGSWPTKPNALDVGAGTGISTRQLAQTSAGRLRWIGVEPGRGMREQADHATLPASEIVFVDGCAEALPIASRSVAVVVAAQAIQWFDRLRFYVEAVRVLLPGGALAVIQNNREWQRSAFLADYETFLETYGDRYTRHYRDFQIEEEMCAIPGLVDVERRDWRWTRRVTQDEFVGLCSSSTKGAAAIKRLGAEPARSLLIEVVRRHCGDAEQVSIEYLTELFLARRQETQ